MLIDDFEEFSSVVEAPLARLKVRKCVKQRVGDTPQSLLVTARYIHIHSYICFLLYICWFKCRLDQTILHVARVTCICTAVLR